MKKCLFIYVLAISITSCICRKENNSMEVLRHKVIDIPGVIIGSPGGLQKKENSLVILDYKSDSLFHLIDIKNNVYWGAFGSKGQGPNEFNHPQNIQIYDDNLYCYDGDKAEIKRIEINNEEKRIACSTFVKFEDNWSFDVIPISNQSFLANGCFEEGMFRVINEKSETLFTIASYPYKDEGEKNIPNKFRAMAYQGTMRMNRKGSIAFAVAQAKLIYLYRLEGMKLIKSGEIVDSYAKYKPDSSMPRSYSVVFDGKSPECYMDLAVTDDFVYALYSGRTFKEFKMSCSECEYIYVYDWTGNFINLYKLDVPVSRICLDESNKKIYAIANLPDPTIVVFEYRNE